MSPQGILTPELEGGGEIRNMMKTFPVEGLFQTRDIETVKRIIESEAVD